MRIAICDDVTADRQAIAVALVEYLKARSISSEVESFARPDDLLAAARRASFDLYLLDVLLNDRLTGIDLVCALRTDGLNVPVIFFSTSREYALDAFSVEAISYLQKPWNRTSFARALDLATDNCHRLQLSLLTFRTSDGIARFSASEIESVETARTVNYITIKRANGNTLTIRGSVRNFIEQYHPQTSLVSAGRSLLINPAQIATLKNSSVRFFSGRSLTVPRSSLSLLAKEVLALSAP